VYKQSSTALRKQIFAIEANKIFLNDSEQLGIGAFVLILIAIKTLKLSKSGLHFA